MNISDPRWAELARFCTIEQEDLDLLRESSDVLVHLDDIVTSFYDHILQQPELKSIIERNSTIDRLGATLKRYVQSIFAGQIDDQRVAGVTRIGVVHDRIDLPLMSYIGAILRIDRIVVPYLIGVNAGDADKAARTVMAYRKVVTMDIAQVTQTFIDARDQTEMLVGQMTEQTEGLSNQQEEISGVSETLAAAAEQSHASATELSHTAETIAERAEGANGAVEECVRLARDGGEVVASTEEAVQGMRSAVDEIATQLSDLTEQTRQITGIVKGISEIADQTNLLALNAAIEAARAGEAGRGFAVVADEVRKLADRTHASLTEISQLNKNSLDAIEAVEGAMTQTTDQVAAVETQAASARASFESISGGVDATAEALGEIATGIDAVSRSTRDLTSTSQEVAGTAEQLARLAEGLSGSLESARQLMASARRDKAAA